MRLIKQTTLQFQEGKSDKVYEVDLCEAGEGEFVVNFRYGRRGTRLKEGTKTPFPESQEKAEAIFEKLVQSKLNRGYREDGDEPETSSLVETSNDPGTQAVGSAKLRAATKKRLAQAAAGDPSRSWPLSRIVWRTGELGMVETAPTVSALSGKDGLTDYVVAWTLGKLRANDGIATLRALRNHPKPEVRRISGEALLQCLKGHDKQAFRESLVEALPNDLRTLLGTDSKSMLAWLEDHPDEVSAPKNTIYDLYAVGESNPLAREAVFDFISKLLLKPPWFRSIRHVFKAAEFRLDGEVYGMLARKFEAQRANPGLYYYQERNELASPNSKYAYGKETRAYLRRRVVRNLKRAGGTGDAQTFITLATGVLIAYDDANDLREPRMQRDYDYDWNTRTSRTIERHFDRYAPYVPLNFLLYQNSFRYEDRKRLRAWQCREDYRPGTTLPGKTLPEGREEAYPELWNEAPDAIAHLLQQSACGAVHEFAVKVWRGNPAFDADAEIAFVVSLLGSPYPITQALALDLARKAYDPKAPDTELLVGMLRCDLDTARALAIGWVEDARRTLVNDASFLANAILTKHEDVHRALRDILSLTKPSAKETFQLVTGKTIAHLLSLSESDPNAGQISALARETLLVTVGKDLREISHEVIGDLLAHPLADVQLLGAQILTRHTASRDDIPDQLWTGLLTSDHEPVRQVGMELFGELSDRALLEKADILANFCISERADLRTSARPIVERLAKRNDDFAQEVVLQFYPMVLRKETYEGVHEDLYQLLEGPLCDHLHVIPSDSCVRMMESRHAAGQQLGLLILKNYVSLDSLPMKTIAKLGGQDLLKGREHVWAFYNEHLARIKEEKIDALRITDAEWEDARQFAFDFFENRFEEDDWTPELLVSICDSVRGDVADFGRRLITRFFQKEDGPTYLLKLSQHPTAEMQMFASNYLERFASDDLTKLQELEGYFVTVLSQVNKGRVAKARTLQFLGNEAIKSEEAAKLIARVLTRQSVTIAIQDKAACIRTLHAIRHHYPQIESPLQRQEIPVYSRA